VRTRCYHACRQRLRFTCSGRWLGWTCGMRQRIDHARRRLGGRYLARSLDGDGCARLGSKHQLCHRRTKTSVQEAGPGRPMAICRAITADYALLSAGGPRRWPALPQRRLIWSSSATCTCLGHDTAASTGQKGLFAGEAGPPQARVHSSAPARGAARRCAFLRSRAPAACVYVTTPNGRLCLNGERAARVPMDIDVVTVLSLHN
jgi:hypothetical protein